MTVKYKIVEIYYENNNGMMTSSGDMRIIVPSNYLTKTEAAMYVRYLKPPYTPDQLECIKSFVTNCTYPPPPNWIDLKCSFICNCSGATLVEAELQLQAYEDKRKNVIKRKKNNKNVVPRSDGALLKEVESLHKQVIAPSENQFTQENVTQKHDKTNLENISPKSISQSILQNQFHAVSSIPSATNVNSTTNILIESQSQNIEKITNVKKLSTDNILQLSNRLFDCPSITDEFISEDKILHDCSSMTDDLQLDKSNDESLYVCSTIDIELTSQDATDKQSHNQVLKNTPRNGCDSDLFDNSENNYEIIEPNGPLKKKVKIVEELPENNSNFITENTKKISLTPVVVSKVNYATMEDLEYVKKSIKAYIDESENKVMTKLTSLDNSINTLLNLTKSQKPSKDQKEIVTFNEFAELYTYSKSYPLNNMVDFNRFNADLNNNLGDIKLNFKRYIITNTLTDIDFFKELNKHMHLLVDGKFLRNNFVAQRLTAKSIKKIDGSENSENIKLVFKNTCFWRCLTDGLVHAYGVVNITIGEDQLNSSVSKIFNNCIDWGKDARFSRSKN